MKRRRFKQTLSLEERLSEEMEQLRKQVDTLPPGAHRDFILRRIRQNETAANMNGWLSSPSLRPPE